VNCIKAVPFDTGDFYKTCYRITNKAKGIFELGNGEAVSNSKVLEIVEEITDKPANIVLVEKMRDYDNDRWMSENFKSRGWGWFPRVSLYEGLRLQINSVSGSMTKI